VVAVRIRSLVNEEDLQFFLHNSPAVVKDYS
jgi:hypothetical protein